MKKNYLFIVALLLATIQLKAQTKIKDGTVSSPTLPNTNAILELESNSRGLLLPRLTQSQRNAMTSVPQGMIIYNTTEGCVNQYNSGGWNSLCSNSTYVDPWYNKATSAPSSNVNDKIYHLGGVTIGTGQVTSLYGLTVGTGDTVTGVNSVAFGQNNRNYGSNSIVSGYNNTNRGNHAFVSGYENSLNNVSGTFIHGSSNVMGSGLGTAYIIGSGNTINSSGQRNFAFGINHTIDGTSYDNYVFNNTNYSNTTGIVGQNMILGNNDSMIGGLSNSMTMGGQKNKLQANGSANIIGGVNNKLINTVNISSVNFIHGQNILKHRGSNTHIFGVGIIDSSSNSFITGRNHVTSPTSINNFVGGGEHNINSTYSFVAGQGHVTNNTMNHTAVVGKYNALASNALFVVGNGTSSAARTNAFTVKSASLIMPKSSTAPAGPVEGEMYFNTTDKKTYVYDGTTWRALY